MVENWRIAVNKLRGMKSPPSFRLLFKDKWLGGEHFSNVEDALCTANMNSADAFVMHEYPGDGIAGIWYGDNVK